MKYLSRRNLSIVFSCLAATLFATSSWSRGKVGSPEISPPLPPLCLPDLPAGLDPKRVVILGSVGNPVSDSRRSVVLEDFQELILSGRYQILSAGSAAAAVPECFAWKIDLDFVEPRAGIVRLALSRFGRKVGDFEEGGRWQEELALPRLRGEIAMQLGLGDSNAVPSLRNPESALLATRLKAMRVFAEGRSGEAAKILSAAVASAADASLRYRLGFVLLAWGTQLSAAASDELRAEGDRLLAEAGTQLEASLRENPDQPLALLSRGRWLRRLGRKDAEQEFVRATTLWPAQVEAVEELVRLRLARGETSGVAAAIEAALRMAEQRERALRASLLRFQGTSRRLEGDVPAALEAFRWALAVAPVERQALRLEIFDEVAQAQLAMGDREAACASWQAGARLGALPMPKGVCLAQN